MGKSRRRTPAPRPTDRKPAHAADLAELRSRTHARNARAADLAARREREDAEALDARVAAEITARDHLRREGARRVLDTLDMDARKRAEVMKSVFGASAWG